MSKDFITKIKAGLNTVLNYARYLTVLVDVLEFALEKLDNAIDKSRNSTNNN